MSSFEFAVILLFIFAHAQEPTSDPDRDLVFVTWALAIPTIILAIIAVVAFIFQSRSQKTITNLQDRLTTAQEKLAEQQKELVTLQQRTSTAQQEAAQALQEGTELREKTIIMETMMEISEIISDTTRTDHRRLILNHFAGDKIETFPKLAEAASGYFDRIGAIVKLNADVRTVYLEGHALKTAKMWKALEQYVKEERTRRHDIQFRAYFEWLGKLAVLHWETQYPDNPIKIVVLPVNS